MAILNQDIEGKSVLEKKISKNQPKISDEPNIIANLYEVIFAMKIKGFSGKITYFDYLKFIEHSKKQSQK